MTDIDTKLKALEEGNFFTKEATALVDALAAALLRARVTLAYYATVDEPVRTHAIIRLDDSELEKAL